MSISTNCARSVARLANNHYLVEGGAPGKEPVVQLCRSNFRIECELHLNTKILLQYLRSRFDLADCPFAGDMTVVDDINPLRQRQRRGDILLHEDDGLPRVSKIAASLHKIAHDYRC